MDRKDAISAVPTECQFMRTNFSRVGAGWYNKTRCHVHAHAFLHMWTFVRVWLPYALTEAVRRLLHVVLCPLLFQLLRAIQVWPLNGGGLVCVDMACI